MSIISDIKNSIKDAICQSDNEINFSFEEIPVAKFPFLHFYFPEFKLEKSINPDYWQHLNLKCCFEYMHDKENDNKTLWDYASKLEETYELFALYDTKVCGRDFEFRIEDKKLKMTFNLDIYVKEVDETELMQELDFTLKEH